MTLTLSLHSVVVHCATALRSCCVCCAGAALRRGCAVQLRRRFLPAALTPYAAAQRQISPLVTLVFEETYKKQIEANHNNVQILLFTLISLISSF